MKKHEKIRMTLEEFQRQAGITMGDSTPSRQQKGGKITSTEIHVFDPAKGGIKTKILEVGGKK